MPRAEWKEPVLCLNCVLLILLGCGVLVPSGNSLWLNAPPCKTLHGVWVSATCPFSSLNHQESPFCRATTVWAWKDRSFQVPHVNPEVLREETHVVPSLWQSTADSDSSGWFQTAQGGRNRITIKRGPFITLLKLAEKEEDWGGWAITFIARPEGQETFQLPASCRSSCLMPVSSSVE